MSDVPVTAAAAAAAWQGWGTAAKPAHEPVVFARKPLSEDTIAANVLRWGTGAINVDACRVGYKDGTDLEAAAAAARVLRDTPGRERWAGHGGGAFNDPAGSLSGWEQKAEQGRWPANVMHDGSLEVLEAFPQSSRDAVRRCRFTPGLIEDRAIGARLGAAGSRPACSARPPPPCSGRRCGAPGSGRPPPTR